MKIAIDLDGVCYEWQRTYRYIANEYLGTKMPPVDEFWTRWDAADEYTGKQGKSWMWSKGVEKGLFRYGHMTTGCRVALDKLAYDNELIIVTHRPAMAVNDTLEWLSFYMKGIPLAGVHILTNQEPKTSVVADILIDDKPENTIEWAREGRIAYLFDRPWNQEVRPQAGIFRCKDWQDVVHKTEVFDAIRTPSS